MQPSPYATPGTIGTISKPGDQAAERKAIWEEGEIAASDNYDYSDPRPQPEYDIIYKQSVGTEDVYLGMGAKNPTTSSCESLVVNMFK